MLIIIRVCATAGKDVSAARRTARVFSQGEAVLSMVLSF
jgi:hypothetical protein